MAGLKAGILIFVIMTSTLCLVPLSNFIIIPEGDYSETEEVSYRYLGTEFTIEVPLTSGPAIRRGMDCQLWQFVTPSDHAVRQLAHDISVIKEWKSDRELASYALYWVQDCIDYVYDWETHGTGEYWQLPCDTLRLGTGDCEDQALLLVSICIALGLDTVLVFEPGHVSTGIRVDEIRSTDNTVTFNDDVYVAADPTGTRTFGCRDPDVERVFGELWNPSSTGVCTIFITLLAIVVIAAIASCYTR
ncbi:transglutaminase-like domain-containing protein [Candidatus Methanoprimaticola sp. MG2]|uniref:transglutaminase-like domain-containing protein n=1 Tax=Candidatus Methanoprimaticola sp. MG2 TaxID=3228838 RepID=UPI0039C70B51